MGHMMLMSLKRMPSFTDADANHWNGFTFSQRAVDVVRNHSHSNAEGLDDKPLFLYMALHNSEMPTHNTVTVRVPLVT